MIKKILKFRFRRIVHYSLIICILLIQLLIAAFFYNEFITGKNISFIKKQLQEIHSLENLTDNSRKDLLEAQGYFQKYIISENHTFLESYFTSLRKLGKNLDSINQYKNKYPRLQHMVTATTQRKDPLQIKKLQSLIDSTYEYSVKSDFKAGNDLPELKKYDLDYNFDKFNIETKTYSDTIKRKGFFGRLGDAISGKENIRKESTVITVKQGKVLNSANIKAEFDSIINLVNHHYTGEVRKIQVTMKEKQNDDGKFFKIFSNLLVYGNGLMNIYEVTIKDSKTDLEKEYNKQNSKYSRIRMYLVFGAMILMFIVSVLIMLLTRIAFIYERKLKAANEQINENLNFKNRILGMLSHELRSPLKIIGIFINRINRKTEDESIKEYLKSISFTNNTLLMQASQILEYTKNQHVENKLIPSVFNLKNEIQSILSSVEPYIETRNNEFVIKEDIRPELTVYSDPIKINQIFMNILGNANKFTENGCISVTVKTEPVNENTVSLYVEISDTGAGISPSDLRNIFEPYYQGILSDDVENLGAGLGLSLCRELAELYSGTVSVTSEINQGTTVVFSLNLNIYESVR
ncbi:HAMP domain-containing sensor histidine kinase [Chryseobacterium sp. JJR-5R]|uniref:sensor histidine kinase n=1 Tax=Chryseobacterium sp. JJR-5R TaxID=3093923 RepID=UPI002A759C77|nr:HAMP domain-containing sensor histidine kinase [Chryseobacterium sp. JJR-5R]WPO83587.1 HAMP domain-containing sensor histidine kinase [Chryseobacterium sp. JJR-5R]